jgi:hypothetical protein
MYDLRLDNRFHRVFAIHVDRLGIDPFRDKIIPKITKITDYRNHEVSQEERGSPDLISFREYGTEDFWWHIMCYNGICSFRDIAEGITLKIPNYGALIAITNDTVSDTPVDNDHIIEL